MDSTLSDLRDFAESFFTNLKCDVKTEGDNLIISNIPKDFENSYGKPGPYTISFDSSTKGELLSRGSFLLKTMMSYLEQRGQTALIKLIFDEDYFAAFKRSFLFKKCELNSLTKKPEYRPIYLFSFSTMLQYINEKEQVMNSIAVKDGLVSEFSLEQYKYETGNSKEIGSPDIKEAYATAKEALKELITQRINEISIILSEKTERETNRIKEHYSSQLTERDNLISKTKEQIANIDKNNSLSPAMSLRRERLLENLKTLEDPEFESKLTKERDFFIRDEEFKHSLNVQNKLVSTMVVYYPVFEFTLALKNNDVCRNISVKYNPLKNDFENPISCEQCKRAIKEIFLCSSAHVLCANCFDSCRSCERGICSLCMKKTCSQCARKLCKRCFTVCTLCWKDMCKSHAKINYATGKEGCTSCLRQCSKCSVFADKAHLVKDTDGSEICLKCSKLSKAFIRE